MSTGIEDNKKLLEEALNGLRGEDQTLIAEIGLEFLTTILRKNIDYGSSVFKPPILNPSLPAKSAIEVRLSDKINRFQQLKTNEANVKTESIQDTMCDFGVYGILWLIADEKERQEKATESTVQWKVHPAIAYPGVLSEKESTVRWKVPPSFVFPDETEKIKVTNPGTDVTFRESRTLKSINDFNQYLGKTFKPQTSDPRSPMICSEDGAVILDGALVGSDYYLSHTIGHIYTLQKENKVLLTESEKKQKLEKNEKYRKLYDIKVQDLEGSIFQRCPNGRDFESIDGTARFHPERLHQLGYIMNRINEHEYILVKAVSSSNTDKNLDGLLGNRFEKLSDNRWGCISTHTVIDDESLSSNYIMYKDKGTGTYILRKKKQKLDIDKYLGQPLKYSENDKTLVALDNTIIPLSEIDYTKYVCHCTSKHGIATLYKKSDL